MMNLPRNIDPDLERIEVVMTAEIIKRKLPPKDTMMIVTKIGKEKDLQEEIRKIKVTKSQRRTRNLRKTKRRGKIDLP